MKKKIFIVLICIVVILLIVTVCCIIGLSINEDENMEENTVGQETSIEPKKVISGTIIIVSEDDSQNKTTATSSDIKMSDEQFNTYSELINSKRVQDKVKKEYPDAGDIEMEHILDTDLVKIKYKCDNYSEEECKDIANKYISVFSELISEVYDVKVMVVDEPEVFIKNIYK